MVRDKGNLYVVRGRKETDTKSKLEDDVDALFRVPLTAFTGARNTLAAELKKSGRRDDANLVKALVKPSLSAWAVNQLYWNHRETFDRLMASGERFHKAQTSRLSGKLANMRGALDARREALTQLSDLATSLLRDAGHIPTPDTIHRITTTLEAMSVYASRSDAPHPGRLTQNVDPPGFESLASFVPAAGTTKPIEGPARLAPSQKSAGVVTNARERVARETHLRQLKETRKRKIDVARVSLQNAKRSLSEARARAQRLGTAQKKAYAEAKEADKRLEKARTASNDADQRMRAVGVEVEEAARSVEDAERTVEKASEELEKLFRESSTR